MKDLEPNYFCFEPRVSALLTERKVLFFYELYSTQFEEGAPVVYIPPLLSGSDYSSSNIVQRSNKAAFQLDFGHLLGKVWWPVYGGYGSYAIAILSDHENAEIKEWLSALERDPVANEQLLWEMERGEEERAWEEDYRSEFVSALEKRFGVDLSDADDVTIDALAIRGQEIANVWWEHEPQGPWLDIEAVADALPADTFTNAD